MLVPVSTSSTPKKGVVDKKRRALTLVTVVLLLGTASSGVGVGSGVGGAAGAGLVCEILESVHDDCLWSGIVCLVTVIDMYSCRKQVEYSLNGRPR